MKIWKWVRVTGGIFWVGGTEWGWAGVVTRLSINHNKLTFNENVSKLCIKASKKVHALAWISNYMTKDKFRTIMNAFFFSQFGYCPLIWMFHNRALNNRINKLQERALSLVHNDNTSSFYELLQKDNSFTIHHWNIQKLALEMYRVKHCIAPKILCELFHEANVPYNLRQTVRLRRCHTSDLKFRIWFLLKSEISRQNKFFAKRLKMETR